MPDFRYAPEQSRAAGQRLLAAVDGVLPLVAEHAEEAERLGRVPDAVVDALGAAGMFRAVTPHQYGGLEVDPAAFFEAACRVASRCASTGWFASLIGIHNWQIAHLGQEAQDEYFAPGPDTLASTSYAPTGQAESVSGGFRVSGRWDFSSGVDHAAWAILGAVIRDIEAPEFRSFVVPRRDFEIDQGSWEVTGLRGTGSKSVVLDGALVPEHMTHRIVDVHERNEPGMRVNDRALFRVPWLSAFWYAIACPAIGAARGGLDAFLDINRARVAASSQRRAAGNPFLHLRVAEAHGRVDFHHARMRQNWTEMFDAVRDAPECSRLLAKRSRYDASNAIMDCFHALGAVYENAGGDVIREGHPVQRFYRDLMAMTNHPAGNVDRMASLYGQELLGLPDRPFDRTQMGSLAISS